MIVVSGTEECAGTHGKVGLDADELQYQNTAEGLGTETCDPAWDRNPGEPGIPECASAYGQFLLLGRILDIGYGYVHEVLASIKSTGPDLGHGSGYGHRYEVVASSEGILAYDCEGIGERHGDHILTSRPAEGIVAYCFCTAECDGFEVTHTGEGVVVP